MLLRGQCRGNGCHFFSLALAATTSSMKVMPRTASAIPGQSAERAALSQRLTAQVPAGGLCVAIRQLVLFPVATPTGWRHIGQTAFRLFRPGSDHPFVLRPGDEVVFEPTTPETLANLQGDANGSEWQPLLD